MLSRAAFALASSTCSVNALLITTRKSRYWLENFNSAKIQLHSHLCDFAGGQDRRILLWNPFSKKSLATLTGHTSSVVSIVVNDNDNQIISLGADKQVKVIAVDRGRWEAGVAMMKHVCRQRFSNQHSLGYRHRQTTAVQQWELAFLYVWKTHLYKCLALPVVQHSCVSCGIQYGLKQQGWVRSFKFCFGLYKG